MKPILEVKDLSIEYGNRSVVSQMELSLKNGNFLAIVGPNGSGKTTLLRAISKVLKPKTGVIYVDGSDIAPLSRRSLARKVAVVPQESLTAFSFTALQVVMMGRTPHLSRWQTEGALDYDIAKDAMQMANCWHLRDRPINELSGGEKQRVIIAQALAQEPKLILLDEPTLHLDIGQQLEIMELLKQLSADGLSILAVLHDLNIAAYYADHLMLVKEGRIEAVGSPQEIVTENNIRRVFGITVEVKKHSLTGKPYIVFVV
ncbi:MAG: ABC transporter ATP-binding protein [Actinomycetota bacterium]